VGVKDAAVLLSQWTCLPDVAPADVRKLIARGMLRAVAPSDWPMVEVDAVWTVDEPPAWLVRELREIGDERRAWWAASMHGWDAATALGLSRTDFDLLAAEAEIEAGDLGRYARRDVDRLRHALMAASAKRQQQAG
jgi:hypothetical protein